MEEPIMRDPDKQGSKTGGGGYTPPGGTGITPGGGFGATGFFGAERGASLGDFFGSGSGMRPKRRVVMGPNGPISVAASPMGTDTVPAMLTPGEGVLNKGAMQQPGMTDFLQAANQQGVSQMAEGGMVGGGIDKDLILKLLHLLLDDDGGEGGVQGFAWGGMVRPQVGGGMRQQAPTAPRMPAGGLMMGQANQTAGVRQQAAPTGGLSFRDFLGGGQRQQVAPPGGGGMTWTPPGSNPSGDPTIDLNDWSGSGWDQSRTLNQLYGLLNQFGGAGAFGPEGNAKLLESLRGEATQNADAIRRRSALNADVQGLDAGQKGAYAMQSDLNTQGDVANTLNSAKLGLLQNQQGLGQDLMKMLAQFNMNDWSAERQGDISKRYAPDGPSGWDQLANLGGAALGGWAGGGFKTPWGKR